jgi:hypothetical protein
MNDWNWRDRLAAFSNYLQEPKTRWEIRDYSLGCAVVIGGILFLVWLAVVLAPTN